MAIIPIFQDIRKHIKEQLNQADTSIYVAVAWFTDRFLFDILNQKAKKGLDVQLIIMDDDITRNCVINYDELISNNGQLFKVDGSLGVLMHNKFCIIDSKVLITGSYNWSLRAQSNNENIIITTDESKLASDFETEFIRIKKLYGFKNNLKPLDYPATIKRLLIIKNLIELNDYESIFEQIDKLEVYFQLPEVNAIIELLKQQDFSIALPEISNFILNSTALRIFEDEEISRLKWLVDYFEIEFIALENEKASIHKLVGDFIHNYTIRFGDILLKIFQIKKERLEKLGNTGAEAFEFAREQFEKFREQYHQEEEKEAKFSKLTDEQKEELKKSYFKAAKMCHPDAVGNRFPNDDQKQAQAEKLFKILNQAYSDNDLEKVNEILLNLENGIYGIEGLEPKKLKKEDLEKRIEMLKNKIERVKEEILLFKSSKDYIKVSSIYDMEEFFKEEEQKLNNELNELVNEQ